MKNQSLVLSTAIAATLTSSMAFADMSANGAASTNYIWRGITQTADASAISGGIDWEDASGLHLGTWVSNVAGGQEVDVYGGYSIEMIDVGFIAYQYPVSPNINFTEVYVTASVENFSGGIYTTTSAASGNAGGAFDKGDLYVTVSADFSPFSVVLGSYMFDNDSAATPLDYIHYGASMSKDDFTFSIDKTDQDGAAGNVRVGVSWSKEWSL